MSRIWAVCSGSGGVGKTTIALALAVGAARAGRRVILLDASGAARSADLILGMESVMVLDLADVSGGSVGMALRADADAGFLPLAERAIRAVTGVRNAADVPQAAQELKDDRERAETALTIMEQFARDRMLVENGVAPFAQGRGQIYSQAALSGRQLLMAVMQARRQLKSNVSWQSVVEMLLLSLCEK